MREQWRNELRRQQADGIQRGKDDGTSSFRCTYIERERDLTEVTAETNMQSYRWLLEARLQIWN